MRAIADSQVFTNISANTSGFAIEPGGLYGVAVVAGTWDSGSVALQRLGPDGSTYINVSQVTYSTDSPVSFSANGYLGGIALCQGTYRFAVTDATGVYAEIIRVPGE